MVNQLGKFSPRLAELTQPMKELLSKNCQWQWDQSQDAALTSVKAEITKPTVLAHYDPKADTKVLADASSFGWEQYNYRRMTMCGSQSLLLRIQYQLLNVTTHRLRKKHWQLPGPATNSQTI